MSKVADTKKKPRKAALKRPARPTRWTRAAVAEAFRRFQEHDPKPTTELEYGNTYQLLVAVALSAQSTDVGVNKATRALFHKVETPQQLLDLGKDELIRHIATIGLFNTKAANLIKAAQILVDLHDGEVTQSRNALEALPGVGRKTANVILNTAFGQPTLAVDTHIFRVANRTGLAPGANVDQVERNLLKIIPEPYLSDAHHWLILHGRYVCKAQRPLCGNCLISDLCKFAEKQKYVAEP